MSSSENSNKPELYLFPTPLGKTGSNTVLPEYHLEVMRSLNMFFVENVRSAQQFLDWIRHPQPDYLRKLYPLDKKTGIRELNDYLDELEREKKAGLLSEAGCPAIADPGSDFVRIAHIRKMKVIPLAGPSSIIMALMASGLPGQQFAFNGYLPLKKQERIDSIKNLEKKALKNDQSQILMETPYRNQSLLDDLISTLDRNTLLSVAMNLTMPDEEIITQPVRFWNRSARQLPEKPAIFIIGRPPDTGTGRKK